MNKLVMIDNKPFLDAFSMAIEDGKALITMPDGYVLVEEDRVIEMHNECIRLESELKALEKEYTSSSLKSDNLRLLLQQKAKSKVFEMDDDDLIDFICEE